jgi:CheY-like chemotaxis protein
MTTPSTKDILCVEPNADAQALLNEALYDFNIVFAVDGYETLRELNRKVFHAYVLEYWIPHWSGTEACRHIRNTDPRVPIVFSSSASETLHARALRAGANAFLRKPIDPPTLRRRLRVMLELAELESKRAYADELHAIDQELRDRAAAINARAGRARLAAAQAIEKSVRSKALAQYVASGGTCAHFDREWTTSFSRAWAIYDDPHGIQPDSRGMTAGGFDGGSGSQRT